MVKLDKFDQVTAAIARAENKTSAEVVVTVVRQSGNYDHVFALVFAILFVLALIGGVETWIYREWLPFGWPPQISLLGLAAVIAVISYFLAHMNLVTRLLSTQAAVDRWVALRAEVEFFENIFGKTAAATGVLIFVSLAERRTVILADAPIFQKLPKKSFDVIMGELNKKIAQNELATGLVGAIDAIGGMLEAHFVRAVDDINEVSDQVILKDH